MAQDLGNRKQFVNWFSVRQNRHGTTPVIDKALVVVDAEVLIDGGPKVVRREGTLDGFLPFAVGGPDNLACPHASS
jgi:hypothetical protein